MFVVVALATKVARDKLLKQLLQTIALNNIYNLLSLNNYTNL